MHSLHNKSLAQKLPNCLMNLLRKLFASQLLLIHLSKLLWLHTSSGAWLLLAESFRTTTCANTFVLFCFFFISFFLSVCVSFIFIVRKGHLSLGYVQFHPITETATSIIMRTVHGGSVASLILAEILILFVLLVLVLLLLFFFFSSSSSSSFLPSAPPHSLLHSLVGTVDGNHEDEIFAYCTVLVCWFI